MFDKLRYKLKSTKGSRYSESVVNSNKYWIGFLITGVVFLITGIVGINMSVSYSIATVFLFGVLALIAGIFQLVHSFRQKIKTSPFHILLGFLYLMTGGILMTNPLTGSIAITLALGGFITVIGISRIFLGIQLFHKMKGWGWIVTTGLLSTILGFLIILQWPSSGLWVIGFLVSIELILHGISYLFISLGLKSLS